MVQYFTLIFPIKDDEILLGYKKRGLGAHLWNGFGGKIEPNEDKQECVIRELHEECGLVVQRDDLIYLGYVHYLQNTIERLVYIYTTHRFSGHVRESEEMEPSWFNLSQIPYNEMWPDAKDWMKLVLTKSFMKCYFRYSSDGLIERKAVEVLTEPPVSPEL